MVPATTLGGSMTSEDMYMYRKPCDVQTSDHALYCMPHSIAVQYQNLWVYYHM